MMPQAELEKYKVWLEAQAQAAEVQASEAIGLTQRTVHLSQANGLRMALVALETGAYDDYPPEGAEDEFCKNCKYFNWRLSGSKNWGECENLEIQGMMRLSLKLVNLDKPGLDEVRTYTRIHFDEDNFGCILFSPGLQGSPKELNDDRKS